MPRTMITTQNVADRRILPLVFALKQRNNAELDFVVIASGMHVCLFIVKEIAFF